MPRRFYLRPLSTPVKSSAPHVSYPRWVIPMLIIVGAGLGFVTYRLTCASNGGPSQASRGTVKSEQSSSGSTTGLQANQTGDGTPSALADVRPRSFEGLRVQVLNGCGVKGLARIVTPGLRSYGFDVRETKNAANFDYKTSAIIDRTGNIGKAKIIADSLGIDGRNVTSDRAANLVDIDVTLIVGADYRRLNLDLGNSNQE